MQRSKKSQLDAQYGREGRGQASDGPSCDRRQGSNAPVKSSRRQLDLRTSKLQHQGRSTLSERPAPLKRPSEQQQPHHQKRIKQDPVAEEFLPFAVYVEKFDEKNGLIKMSGKEFDIIKADVANAFWLETKAVKGKLKNDVDRRLFSSERGTATFFAKSEFPQAFIIKTINNLVKLPGVKARGPRVESKPNLHVDFPAALEKMSPEVVIKWCLQEHANVDCEPVICNIRPWALGRTVSVELPADKLAQLASWAIDTNEDSFGFCAERLYLRASFKPKSDPLKTSKEAKEVIDTDQEMTVASLAPAGALATPATAADKDKLKVQAGASPPQQSAADSHQPLLPS